MIRKVPSQRLSLFLLLALLLLLTAGTSHAQTKSYYWDRLDVDIQVLENGNLLVTEQQSLNFSGAPFTFGFRTVPTGSNGNNDGISQVSVSEGDITYEQSRSEEPYTFSVNENSGEAEIYWYFPPSTGNNRYTISYLVEGGVRTEASGDQVFWNALPADLGARVQNSRMTITLPEGVELGSTIALFGGSERNIQTTVSDDGRRAVFELLQGRPAGTTVEVGVRFPTGQIEVPVPSWQRSEQIADAIDLLLLIVGLLLLIGGPLLVLLLWYQYGRDPDVGPVPEYLPQPPDDTPPAVVGTLVDETAHIHDIMSTLIDLARRGYLTMAETGKAQDYEFTRTDKATTDLRPFEKKMIDGIFRGQQTRDLDSLRYKFADRLPAIRTELYKELQERQLVPKSPEDIRNRYGCLAIGLFIAAVASFFFIPGLISDALNLFFCPSAALAVIGATLFIVGRYMPRKTKKGAQASAYWLAFKQYLKEIESYADLEEAADIFDKYLPYAVAFGLERSWIRKFSAVPGTHIPPWYIPYPYYGAGRTYRGGTADRTGGGVPDLGDLSGGFSGGLAAMSGGLTRMLTSTQSILQSTRPSSSGGSSGGGFSGGFSGGSSGGGGGGFG
jgi:uncharacterized membrane protein YgcG